MNIGIERIENLPFQTILVPLSVYFAVQGNKEVTVLEEDKRKLIQWFWRVCFSRRYSSGVIRNLEEDIKAMNNLKNKLHSTLGSFNVSIDENYFINNEFGLRNVNTKTFVLLLAHKSPLSYISGTPIDLSQKLKEYNKAEFHHIMPKASLRDKQLTYSVNCLANIAFMSRSENRELGGGMPSEYKSKMVGNPEQVLERSICPDNIFLDDYDAFVKTRSLMLASYAKRFIDGDIR